jgi:glycosyltransferase involved in cell wall biosynthesis
VWPGEDTANWLDRALFRLSLLGLRRTDRIVADSHTTAASIVDHLGIKGEMVRVVHLGVDPTLFHRHSGASEALEQRFGITQEAGVHDLLYVGTEAPRKNLETLLKAMAILKEDDWQVRLIKVGRPGYPGYRAAFQRRVEALGLGKSVLLVEEVAEADLPLFYSAADVFVLPSYVEGFGLPALEAMACGTPVVCSNAGALPEVAGDAALLVEPRDARGLAEAIGALLADRALRQDQIARGLARSRQFTWDQTAAETLAVYHGLSGAEALPAKRGVEAARCDGREGA